MNRALTALRKHSNRRFQAPLKDAPRTLTPNFSREAQRGEWNFAPLVEAIYEQMRTGVMAGGYIEAGETPIEYLELGHGRTRQGYLWTCARLGGYVISQWETSRAAECLHNLIAVDFSGTLQCSWIQRLSISAVRSSRRAMLGARAPLFLRSLAASSRTAGWFVRQIQHLYQVEAHMRQSKASPKLRGVVRQHHSRSIVSRIHNAMVRLKQSGRYLPKSLLGQAMDYALGQWASLLVFLTDGRIEIDNNLVENAIRPTALGKKNWLFIGNAEAGDRGAILYAIVESCRRRGIDPYTYLRDVLTRFPHMTNWQIKEVTPQASSQAQRPRHSNSHHHCHSTSATTSLTCWNIVKRCSMHSMHRLRSTRVSGLT